MNNLFKKIVKIGATIATGYAVYKIMDNMAEKCASERIEIENVYVNEITDVETEEEKKEVEIKRVVSHIKILVDYYGKLLLLSCLCTITSAAIWKDPKKRAQQQVSTINYQIAIV